MEIMKIILPVTLALLLWAIIGYLIYSIILIF
jgi:hypothetical protein